MVLTKEQAEEIGRLITEGFTSGRLDDEQENGSYIFIAWKLETNIWDDKD